MELLRGGDFVSASPEEDWGCEGVFSSESLSPSLLLSLEWGDVLDVEVTRFGELMAESLWDRATEGPGDDSTATKDICNASLKLSRSVVTSSMRF